MKRRTFLWLSGLIGVALSIAAPAKAQVSRTGILRRKEYKRRRWYKRRARRRSSISRILKQMYCQFRDAILPMTTPLLVYHGNSARSREWGGNGVYWDVTSNADAGPATTRDTPQGAVPVHSAVSGSASRRRFWRNPFLA